MKLRPHEVEKFHNPQIFVPMNINDLKFIWNLPLLNPK